MKPQRKSVRVEIEDLRRRLQEAEETLDAIRSGEVDALVVSGPEGEKVFTLRGAEHPYRVLIESINEGAATLTHDGTILYGNLALARLVQRPLKQVIGKQIQEFVAPEVRDQIRTLLENAATGAVRAEIELHRGAAGNIAVLLSLNPVELDEQQTIAAIITDLSERIKRERAQEAVRARDEFIAVASHELRTPLSALILQLGMTERTLGRADLERSRQIIQKASGQVGRITALVDRLLDVSRIAGGQLTLELGEHDIGEIIREVAERFREEAEQSGSTIRVTAPLGMRAQLDRSRIDQAISNLFSNAVKYGGGKEINITLQARGEVCEIQVRDHGMGMKPEDLERIFERFERSSSARNFGGLGLGLYITRQILLQHGGKVRAESNPGDGATFVIELPLNVGIRARRAN